jgi:hypothetical protein
MFSNSMNQKSAGTNKQQTLSDKNAQDDRTSSIVMS